MPVYTTKTHIRKTASEISQKAYGYSTGYVDMDRLTFGLHQSELIIVAGRPSMGKSALLTNIASRSAVQVPQLIFSVEMPYAKLMERMIADTSEIPHVKLKRGDILEESEQDRLEKAIVKLENRQIFIDERSVLTPGMVRECCEKLVEKTGIREFVVYIDYLQLMSPDTPKASRALEIDTIMASLRAIMKDFNVPIVVASQLNRELERRQNHEPRLSDLRESGGIEQAADTVLLLHRPSYYKMKEIDLEAEDDGEAYIFIAKQRNGVTGKVPMIWIPDFMGFRSIGALDVEDPNNLFQEPDPPVEEEIPTNVEDGTDSHLNSIKQEIQNDGPDTPMPDFMQGMEVDDSDGEIGMPNPEFNEDYEIPDDDIPF